MTLVYILYLDISNIYHWRQWNVSVRPKFQTTTMPQPKGARFIRGDVNSPILTVFLSTKTAESSLFRKISIGTTILYASVFIFIHYIHIIYLHMLELKRAKILSLSDVCAWKGISVGSPSVVTMSSFQKCWKVSKVPVLANSSLVNMKGLMFVVRYPTFAKFGKKIWRPISSAPLSVAILWTPEQLLWSIGNRVESTGWSGILTPSIYSRLGWDLCTMLFRTGGVADHFLLDLVGAVKCRLQIRCVPTCFVCLLTFACMVWFFDDFFVCWEHLGSQLVSWLDCVFHWFIWHGRVPTQDVYCQASSVISTATWVYQPVLIS